MRWLFVIVVLTWAGLAIAQQPATSATATASAASAAPSVSASAAPQLPPGHPPPGQMPAGHPPPGHGSQNTVQNRTVVDPELPPGTIDVQILDATGKPVPHAPITLGILFSSVTEGEKRDRKAVVADAEGRYRFTDMKWGVGTSYRVTSNLEEASFGSDPFGLKDTAGVRTVLHVFKPVKTLAQAAFVMEAIVLLEIKEDSIAVNHLVRTVNVGDVAFISDIRVPLPNNFKAFTTQEQMGGHGVSEEDGSLVLHGTFPPGQAEVTYRYMIPLEGGDEQRLRLPMWPRVIATRVVMGAGPDMKMEIAGFPAARAGRWHDGKRVLETQRKADVRLGMQSLMANLDPQFIDVKLSGIPTPGPSRLIALMLMALAVCGGSYYLYWSKLAGASQKTEEHADLAEARDALLDELAALEQARNKGDVGPQSYKRLRDALLDALARIVTRLDATKPKHKKPKKKKKKKRKKTAA